MNEKPASRGQKWTFLTSAIGWVAATPWCPGWLCGPAQDALYLLVSGRLCMAGRFEAEYRPSYFYTWTLGGAAHVAAPVWMGPLCGS